MVQHVLHVAWEAIRTVMVDNTAQRTTWNNWTLYARECWIDPYMRCLPKSLKQTYPIAFAAPV
jgi:hypothetical protein